MRPSDDRSALILSVSSVSRPFDPLTRPLKVDRLASVLPSGPTGRNMTAQGHPRAIFSRAIEHGNLVVAEATARELGRLTLEEALRLLLLYAEKEPVKFERAALRWLSPT